MAGMPRRNSRFDAWHWQSSFVWMSFEGLIASPDPTQLNSTKPCSDAIDFPKTHRNCWNRRSVQSAFSRVLSWVGKHCLTRPNSAKPLCWVDLSRVGSGDERNGLYLINNNTHAYYALAYSRWCWFIRRRLKALHPLTHPHTHTYNLYMLVHNGERTDGTEWTGHIGFCIVM